MVIRNSSTRWDGMEGVVEYALSQNKWTIEGGLNRGFNVFKLEEVELVDV